MTPRSPHVAAERRLCIVVVAGCIAASTVVTIAVDSIGGAAGMLGMLAFGTLTAAAAARAVGA